MNTIAAHAAMPAQSLEIVEKPATVGKQRTTPPLCADPRR
jgi:hypothetical protein